MKYEKNVKVQSLLGRNVIKTRKEGVRDLPFVGLFLDH